MNAIPQKGDIIGEKYFIIDVKQEFSKSYFLYTVQRVGGKRCYDAIIFTDTKENTNEIVAGVTYKDFERCKCNLLAHYIDCGLNSVYAYFIFEEKKCKDIYDYLSFMSNGIKDNTIYDFMKGLEKKPTKNNTPDKKTEQSEFQKKLKEALRDKTEDKKNAAITFYNRAVTKKVHYICESIKKELLAKANSYNYSVENGRKSIKGSVMINDALLSHVSEESLHIYNHNCEVELTPYVPIRERNIEKYLYFSSMVCLAEKKKVQKGKGLFAIVDDYYRYTLGETAKKIIKEVSQILEPEGIEITYIFHGLCNLGEGFTSSDFVDYTPEKVFLTICYKKLV